MENVVYSSPSCGKCKMLKRWLDMKKIGYEEVDITVNETAREKILGAGRGSLPVLEIKNKFVDYNEYNDILDFI